jgi:nitrite reductase/ring-hydroxylating ferredoxin subunit
MSTKVYIGDREDFPPGEIQSVDVSAIDEYDVAVCSVDGTLTAFADQCTHMQWPLSDGYLEDGLVYCSLHLACFDPHTGACEGEPASEPVQTYDVVEEEGEVYLLLDIPDGAQRDASGEQQKHGSSAP